MTHEVQTTVRGCLVLTASPVQQMTTSELFSLHKKRGS
jgi:hypothetical protein